MNEPQEEMTRHFSRYFTAFCLSKAILEDYAQVVSKLDGTPADEVEKRVKKRMGEIGDAIKAEDKGKEKS